MKENGKIRDDGRLCVHQRDMNEMRDFNIDRVHTTIVEAGTIFRQIESFIRFLKNGGEWIKGRSIIDDFKSWPNEPTDDPRLCVVWNPETKLIQFSAIGMNLYQAEISAHYGALYMDALSMRQSDVWDDHYGVLDGGADNS
jgi:hypothetical protein